jgi:hypothetical protein
MTEDDLDRNRRHFLTVATVVTGVAGAGMALIPFISSLKPSARAQALGAPVEVPLGSMNPGEMVRVIWRGKLVFVLRRTEEMLSRLPEIVETSSPIMRPTQHGRFVPSSSSSRVRARTWAAPRSRISKSVPPRAGRVVSSARATARNSILPDVYIKVSRHRRTCGFRRTDSSGMT